MALLELVLNFVGSAKGMIAGCLMALMAFAGVIFKARRSGRLAERAETEAKEAKGVEIAKKIEDNVVAMPSSKKREELKKWSKKP